MQPEPPDSGILSYYVAVTPHLSLPGGLGPPGITASPSKPRTCQEGLTTNPLNAGFWWLWNPAMGHWAWTLVWLCVQASNALCVPEFSHLHSRWG